MPGVELGAKRCQLLRRASGFLLEACKHFDDKAPAFLILSGTLFLSRQEGELSLLASRTHMIPISSRRTAVS